MRTLEHDRKLVQVLVECLEVIGGSLWNVGLSATPRSTCNVRVTLSREVEDLSNAETTRATPAEQLPILFNANRVGEWHRPDRTESHTIKVSVPLRLRFESSPTTPRRHDTMYKCSRNDFRVTL